MPSFAYRTHLRAVRSAYASQRDALVSALAALLPEATFDRPAGGWFVWLRLPDGIDTARLLPAAEAAGVSFVPGARFWGAARFLRLSFSMLKPEALHEGVRRLAGEAQRGDG
jgi:2-aminoadipate transaminase